MNLLQTFRSPTFYILQRPLASSLKLPKHRAWMSHKVSRWKTILWEFVFSRGIKLLNATDGFLFQYQFAVVHLAALLNETNLSKRKRKHTVVYLLYISEATPLSKGRQFFFGSLLSL